MAKTKTKRWLVIFEATTVKAAANPDEPARRIHEVVAPSQDEAVEQVRQADMRHSMRLLDDANRAKAENRTADAKMLTARANMDDWKLKSAEEIK